MHAFAKALQSLPPGPCLLAVSGGRDSMVLLHAFVRHRRPSLAAVATFDHGTGPAAAQAVELVVQECLMNSVPVIAGRAPDHPAGERTESGWRAARWTFLRAAAAERGATIVTAHSFDDQAETVAMRILRGASARGLAAMEAPSVGVMRPLLGVRRSEIAAYALLNRVPFVDDPTNADQDYLRNRLRADLMHSAEHCRPGFAAELVEIGHRSASWRAQVAELVDGLGAHAVGSAVVLGVAALEGLTADGLAIVWPEVAARAGVVMDRRGIERLVRWSPRAQAGQRMPLSGGAVVERTARTFVVRGGHVNSDVEES